MRYAIRITDLRGESMLACDKDGRLALYATEPDATAEAKRWPSLFAATAERTDQ